MDQSADQLALTMTLSGTERFEPMLELPLGACMGHMGRGIEIDVGHADTIQHTAALLPPTPGNTLLDFLEGVVAGVIEPALCSLEPVLDGARYWEKRRVQNSLRRLLEALQQVFGADSCVEITQLAAAVFDELLRCSRSSSCVLDAQAFEFGIEALGAWPPELSAADRGEVFAAFRAPTTAAMRALNAGQPLPTEISRRMFIQGLARLPFNVPDFPVPAHLLGSGQYGAPRLRTAQEVAEAIAEVFCMEQTGLERVKDYFLCGLISLEEIQGALPQLVADSLVEEAVAAILRSGSERFTQREWQSMVISLRMLPEADAPVCSSEPQQEDLHVYHNLHSFPMLSDSQLALHEPPPPALKSPGQSTRRGPPSMDLGRSMPHEEAIPSPTCLQRPPAAMSEMTSCREVRSEEPVRFQGGQQCSRLIDWSTSIGGGSENGVGGHQADESAGGIRSFAGVPRDEAVRLISLDMHNECLGPFLVRAFVRCCQLYEART